MFDHNKNLSLNKHSKSKLETSPHKCPPPRVKLIVERQVACKNSAKSGRAGKKKRDLEKELPTEKVDVLCKRLRDQGLWQFDEDWPQDEEDLSYHNCS